jgi:hypothetical protein
LIHSRIYLFLDMCSFSQNKQKKNNNKMLTIRRRFFLGSKFLFLRKLYTVVQFIQNKSLQIWYLNENNIYMWHGLLENNLNENIYTDQNIKMKSFLMFIFFSLCNCCSILAKWTCHWLKVVWQYLVASNYKIFNIY